MSEVLEIKLLVNERTYPLRLEPRRTVLVDGDPVRACLMFAV
jgi:hypothetical protein